MKTYWHKSTGVPVCEASYMELVRCGAYRADEFEEALEAGPSTTIVEKEVPYGRSVQSS